jgi:hypothetical protein
MGEKRERDMSSDFSLFVQYIQDHKLTQTQVNALLNKLQDQGLIADNVERPEQVSNADWMRVSAMNKNLLDGYKL